MNAINPMRISIVLAEDAGAPELRSPLNGGMRRGGSRLVRWIMRAMQA